MVTDKWTTRLSEQTGTAVERGRSVTTQWKPAVTTMLAPSARKCDVLLRTESVLLLR